MEKNTGQLDLRTCTVIMVSDREKRRNIQRVVLYASIAICIDRRRKKLFKKKQIKRFWTRRIFRDRRLHSEYFTLYKNLRDSDREFHFKYVRMSKERFDHLLSLVCDKIMKKDTQMRSAITAEERLLIWLPYLASGVSQQDLCWSFRIVKMTASNIVREVCVAI